MNHQEVSDRLDLLSSVIKYARVKTAIFSTGEIILINQERASLFEMLDYLSGIRLIKDCRCYRVPVAIENKIDLINFETQD